MSSLKYSVVCIFIALAGAQHIVDKPCPERPVQQNFDIAKYASGVWYDVLRYEAKFSIGCDCGFANYDLNEDSTVKVRNCCKRLPDTTLSCTTGQAKLAEPNHIPLEGKFNVALGPRPSNATNYLVLSTDYDNYSIVYYCRDVKNNKSSEFAWLLSRQPQLSETVKATADGLIDAHFTRSAMYAAVQSDEKCEPRDP